MFLPLSSFGCTSFFISSLLHKELTWGQFIIQRQEEPTPNKKLREGAEPDVRKPTADFDAFDDDDVSAICGSRPVSYTHLTLPTKA